MQLLRQRVWKRRQVRVLRLQLQRERVRRSRRSARIGLHVLFCGFRRHVKGVAVQFRFYLQRANVVQFPFEVRCHHGMLHRAAALRVDGDRSFRQFERIALHRDREALRIKFISPLPLQLLVLILHKQQIGDRGGDFIESGGGG